MPGYKVQAMLVLTQYSGFWWSYWLQKPCVEALPHFKDHYNVTNLHEDFLKWFYTLIVHTHGELGQRRDKAMRSSATSFTMTHVFNNAVSVLSLSTQLLCPANKCLGFIFWICSWTPISSLYTWHSFDSSWACFRETKFYYMHTEYPLSKQFIIYHLATTKIPKDN